MISRAFNIMAMCLVLSAAAAAARPMGSERTLAAAAANPGIPAGVPGADKASPCAVFAETFGTLGTEELTTATNPDSSKFLTTVISGGGGTGNVDKCAAAFHNCAVCSAGYKACEVCADYTNVGGFKYELYGGICAVRIHFDDLAIKAGDAGAMLLPMNYKDFQWTNLAVFNPTGYKPSGYVNGVVSPTNVALNVGGKPAEMAAIGFTFDLVSLRATAGWNNGLSVTFIGSAGGAVVNTKTVTVDAAAPSLISFGAGWEGLEKLRVESSGGVKVATYTSKGTHVVLDDIMVA